MRAHAPPCAPRAASTRPAHGSPPAARPAGNRRTPPDIRRRSLRHPTPRPLPTANTGMVRPPRPRHTVRRIRKATITGRRSAGIPANRRPHAGIVPRSRLRRHPQLDWVRRRLPRPVSAVTIRPPSPRPHIVRRACPPRRFPHVAHTLRPPIPHSGEAKAPPTGRRPDGGTPVASPRRRRPVRRDPFARSSHPRESRRFRPRFVRRMRERFPPPRRHAHTRGAASTPRATAIRPLPADWCEPRCRAVMPPAHIMPVVRAAQHTAPPREGAHPPSGRAAMRADRRFAGLAVPRTPPFAG